MVNNPPANQEMPETQVQFLGWEDLMEEKMLTTPIFLPGEFLRQRSLAVYGP